MTQQLGMLDQVQTSKQFFFKENIRIKVSHETFQKGFCPSSLSATNDSDTESYSQSLVTNQRSLTKECKKYYNKQMYVVWCVLMKKRATLASDCNKNAVYMSKQWHFTCQWTESCFWYDHKLMHNYMVTEKQVENVYKHWSNLNYFGLFVVSEKTVIIIFCFLCLPLPWWRSMTLSIAIVALLLHGYTSLQSLDKVKKEKHTNKHQSVALSSNWSSNSWHKQANISCETWDGKCCVVSDIQREVTLFWYKKNLHISSSYI